MDKKEKDLPGIFIVGNFFGNQKDMPTTQAEEVKKIFEQRGVQIYFASRHIPRLTRLMDTLWSMWRWSKHYSIVQIHFYGGLALILEDMASLLAKWLGKTIIFTLHGGAIPDKARKHPAWYRRVLSRGAVITCPSAYLIHHLQPLGLNFRLIENTIPLADYHFQEKKVFRPRLLWMRSFHPIYHPEMALEVAKLLQPRYPDLVLYMAGADLGYLDAVRQLAKDMGLEQQVLFPGYIDIDKKNQLAESCDLYLCTNRIDNTPVSLIEMMALGVPIVSTNVGGIPYLVRNEEEALLVDSEDAPAMAAAIERILADPALGQHLAKQGRILAARYNEDKIAEKWLQLLQQI